MPLGATRLLGLGRYIAPTGRTARTVEAINDAQVDTAQSKFGGASALFEGTNDYLRYTPVSTKFGTQDFTVEMWFRTAAKTQQYPVLWNNMAGFGTDAIVIHERHSSYPNNLTVWVHNESTGAPVLTSTTTIANTTWYHLAVVRDGSTLRLFINGTEEDTHTIVNSDIDPALSTTYAYVGGNTIGNSAYDGHIDELRISSSARYTSNFTPSTTAFTNDTDTTLLLHMNGTDASTVFKDDAGVRAQVGISALNDAQIDTAQSEFGGASALFDGNNDYLSLSALPTITGDCTIEGWGRFDILPWNQTVGGGSYMMFYTKSSSDYWLINRSGASGSQVNFQIATGNKYGSFTKSGSNLAIDTWYHLAIVRNSGVWKAFFDGTELTTFTNDSNFTNSGRTEDMAFGTIGRFIDSRGSWDGFLDEIRVSDIARYTGDFTPSAAAFTNDANTLLLIHANGTDATKDFEDDNT